MRSRKVLLASLFLLTLALGAWILIDQRAATISSHFRWASISEGIASAPWLRNPSLLLRTLPHQLYSFLNILRQNSELAFYGLIALFGILMMGLAIGNATSRPRDKTQSMVELLKQEKQKAENVAKLKSEFLNQVSHELRTPLAVIIGYLECITDGLYGQLETKHQEILQVVAKQSSHLKGMIDQILIFSRLEASKQALRIDEFSVHKIFNDLNETFEFLCRQKGIDLTWELPKDVTVLKSDPDRFKEIVSNLLQNAVKYTDHGSISVRVRALTATDSIVLEVSDTGVGIPESYLPTIFEPFIQAHKTSTENSRGGIGLGLSIVKKHVEQLKGTITVESEVGKGSTFRIILPRIYREGRSRSRNLFRLLKLSSRKPADIRPRANIAARPQEASPRTRATG